MSDLYTYMSQVNSKVEQRLLDVGTDKPAVLPSTESHIWGRIIEVGMITIEVMTIYIHAQKTLLPQILE